MFQPEVICFGGGVSGAGERILEPDIQGIKSYEQVCGQIEKMLLNYGLICG